MLIAVPGPWFIFGNKLIAELIICILTLRLYELFLILLFSLKSAFNQTESVCRILSHCTRYDELMTTCMHQMTAESRSVPTDANAPTSPVRHKWFSDCIHVRQHHVPASRARMLALSLAPDRLNSAAEFSALLSPARKPTCYRNIY